MHLILDDTTGLVAIHSDYGAASYCWTAIGQRTLAEFFCSASPHYLLNKFSYDNPSHKEREVDIDKTRQAISSYLDEESTRRVIEELEHTSVDAALSRVSTEQGFNEFEVYELLRWKPKPGVTFWLEEVIPAVQEFLRREFGID